MLISLEEAEAVAGAPADEWKGRCHEISMKLAPHIEGAKVRRGYFHGQTTATVMQHSWIELPDGTVLDPTCHAFTDRPPLWHGPAEEYDIGGCRFAQPRSSPPSYYETDQGEVELNLGSARYLADLLGQDSDLWSDLEEDDSWILVSVEQLYWLANLPVQDKEQDGVLARWFAAEVYEAIIKAGHAAAIPIDRRKWILDEPY